MIFKKIVVTLCLCFSTIMIHAQTDTTVYTIVEQMPEYPDGLSALFKYLGQNIKYPAISKENGIYPSTIHISFIVEKDGTLSDIKCKRGCEQYKEADKNDFIEMIRKMPTWKPGKQNGQYVRVAYTIPIKICFRD
jgi:periplasmic protein TonB